MVDNVAPGSAAGDPGQTAATQARIVGDDTRDGLLQNPFHLTFSPGFIAWLGHANMALLLTTYQAGKVVLIGPNRGKLTVSERNFGRAMAMVPVEDGLLLSTEYAVWRFQNGLRPGRLYDGWDTILLPRSCHVTGAVDTHDIAIDGHGRLLAVITGYNCIAQLEEKGCFSPLWRPPFVPEIAGEDRCHLNGFCLHNGELAYATIIGESNVRDGWREHRTDGGLVIDVRTNRVVCRGLSMPHTPRLYRGSLWVLEAGCGWLGRIDVETGEYHRLTWCPGFVRGLRFHGDFALVGLSRPRDKTFKGLPLDAELAQRGVESECGVYVIRLSDGEIMHKVAITGSVTEIYDVMAYPQTQCPMIVGLEAKDVRQLVDIGTDYTGTDYTTR